MLSDVIGNLQIVKQDLAGITEFQMKKTISETIDLLSKTKKKKEIVEGIQMLNQYLQRKINESAKVDFLDKNKMLYKYIKS